MPEVRIDELQKVIALSLQCVEIPAEEAGVISEVLVDSELRSGYGVAVLGPLIAWYRKGVLNPHPQIRPVQETPSALLLDADRACGILAAHRAMRWCIERAQAQRGIACAGVRNSGTCGPLAPYVTLAAEAGL